MASKLFLAALLARAYGSPGLAMRDFEEADMTVLARDSRQAKVAEARIMRVASKVALPRIDVKMDDAMESFGVHWDNIYKDTIKPKDGDLAPESEGYHFTSVVDPATLSYEVEIIPNIEKEIMSGHGPSTYTVSSSTARVDIEREGWSKDSTSEVSLSSTVEVGFNSLFARGSASVTAGTTQRTSEGTSGEKTKQTEFREEEEMRQECPPLYFCSVQTWTYQVKVTGNFTLLPTYQITDKPFMTMPGFPQGSYHLGTFNPDQKLGRLVDSLRNLFNGWSQEFFGRGSNMRGAAQKIMKPNEKVVDEYNDTFGQGRKNIIKTLLETAPEPVQGVYMPPDGVIKDYWFKDLKKTYTYTLRKTGTGEPYRTVVVLSYPLETLEEKFEGPKTPQLTATGKSKPAANAGEGKEDDEDKKGEEEGDEEEEGGEDEKPTAPNAVAWIVDQNGNGTCKLEDGWWCSTEWRYYSPDLGEWFTADPEDWNPPENLDEVCPLIRAAAPEPTELDASLANPGGVEGETVDVDALPEEDKKFIKEQFLPTEPETASRSDVPAEAFDQLEPVSADGTENTDEAETAGDGSLGRELFDTFEGPEAARMVRRSAGPQLEVKVLKDELEELLADINSGNTLGP